MYWRYFMVLACFIAALGVLLGAFAAHGLKNKLSLYELSIFETGVRYQMYHAFALFALAFVCTQMSVNKFMISSGILFTVGCLLFSGSLYALSLTSMKWVGIITPIGGLCFILGWALLGISIWV